MLLALISDNYWVQGVAVICFAYVISSMFTDMFGG